MQRGNMNRRTFLNTSATLVGASITAKGQGTRSGALPTRREFLIRDAYVMTMDPELADIAGGSVHVRDGNIVAVGKNLHAPEAEVIDGRGMIVLPGLIDTHWHMWNTLLRSFAGDQRGEGYIDRRDHYGSIMTPEDMYRGTSLAALEAVNSGITTVHDWGD